MAILLAEHIGAEALRERVKIYATDVDEEALAEARAAVYQARQVSDVPPDLLAKYFDRSGLQYRVHRELRCAVVFGRHDLVQDAAISRIDLLVCRNTLMYFQSEAQSRILARFYFAVNPGGYILLGRTEMLFSHAAMFQPFDLKRRVFRTVSKPNHRDRLLLLAQTGCDVMTNNPANQARLREAAFETEFKSLQDELQHSKQELETAYEELQSTNEELETTNEELQSTVKELETTNEALQSTNEELETTNEERRAVLVRYNSARRSDHR